MSSQIVIFYTKQPDVCVGKTKTIIIYIRVCYFLINASANVHSVHELRKDLFHTKLLFKNNHNYIDKHFELCNNKENLLFSSMISLDTHINLCIFRITTEGAIVDSVIV